MEKGIINRFIELREKRLITQDDMGRLLGVSNMTISRMESGKTPISEKHIKLICGALGVHEKWLKTGEGPIFTDDTPGQKQLLDAFRQLSPEGRKLAIKVVEAMVDYEIERAFIDGVRDEEGENPGKNA